MSQLKCFLFHFLNNKEKSGKMHFSCEIDQKGFFIKTQLCKLRVILRSRVLRWCIYRREGYGSVTPLLMPASTGLETFSLILCTETV